MNAPRGIQALTGPSTAAQRRPWFAAIDPGTPELAELALHFREEDLRHALDPHERPRVRATDAAVLVVLRTAAEPDATAPMTTRPFGILLTPARGLVISAEPNELVEGVIAFIEGNPEDAANHAHRVALHALEATAEDYLRRLAELNETIERIEAQLERSLGNAEVLTLLRHQKSLMHFTLALEEMHDMLGHLGAVPLLRAPASDRAWLDDVRVEVRQALRTAKLSSDVLSQMMDAFASIISNNLNVVMKFLASVTVVLTLPILVASFYGMNVALPGQHSPSAFAATVVSSAVGCAVLVVLLRRRSWL